ncbi:hypothetical protein MNBD_ALPHA09-1592 [hydrothermal vent metagenome]|uniref:Uncharacterized protein n=1 Tax=hydrothermal vent metagenome TaxID=652676 RepID=A0A3B0TYB1_9ZZZZ
MSMNSSGPKPAPGRTSTRSWFFRRGPMENLATVIICVGVFMLMQPFSIWAYGWSFATILTGTVMFIIVSHFPE